ncbi:hypothetical protein AVEN_50176-1 [Araneus ventricosus]|uniref:Uncharacterized protein n=1 Tax=Araneus ventricosus TaxID=182803 RepID=A0A4Y2UF65_ARAVE|nr:hypothetical protein AVEN_50176-1 [Araneus ventricosus]
MRHTYIWRHDERTRPEETPISPAARKQHAMKALNIDIVKRRRMIYSVRRHCRQRHVHSTKRVKARSQLPAGDLFNIINGTNHLIDER